MKKVFLLLTMLLFAFVGTMRADVVEIGSLDGAGNNSYLPMNSLYEYSFTEQIYTADEIGMAGTINSITMWLYGNANLYTMPFNIYMVEVDKNAFESNSDWVTVTADDIVYSGEVTVHNTEAEAYEFELDNPFNYSGDGNLVIAFLNNTGQWKSGLNGKVFGASSDAKRAIIARRDSTPYDITNLPSANSTTYQRNVITLDITPAGPGGALTTTPDVLDLGYRPNGAWMAPYVFTINGTGTTVNALDFSGNYFTYSAELPATLTSARPLEVALTTGTAEEGAVNSTMTVLFSGNRDAQQFNVTANAYNPVNGDVYEKATAVSSFPYNGTAPAGIYKNYNLPTETEGADAVYTMTFANDVLLTAGTTGADGVVALYTEDFEGEGGPMEDNNYVYNGPTINPGPMSMWFSYSYTGSNTFFGTSAGGGMIFGYRITPEMLQELGLGNCAITTVEAAAREGSYYDLIILKGGDTPDLNNMVYYQPFDNYEPFYFFDVNLDEPQFLGDDENIWVMFFSDSPYAAYCGKQPVDAANSKIWYTTNMTTYAFYSNTTYTPVIYTRFLELPTGREVTVNLADMTIRESKPAAGQIAEANGDVMGVAKAQLKQNNNRAVVENDNIEDLYVKAGTYYLVAASTDDEFPVAIETAEVPAPEQAVVIYPYDGETNVEAPYLAEWMLGNYTEEMQVLVGTQYPPQTALIDWTDYLVESAFLLDLEPNQSYFMQVNERNSAGTTMGEIIAFTTPIDPVQNFAAESEELYPGEAAVFTWDANRTFQGYNMYMNGEKINESVITTNTYSVEGLEYNMAGYNFQVTAVYDAGESVPTEAINVKMTGFGSVEGYVYDTDTLHPIAGATIVALGLDEFDNAQTFEFTTDENGFYEGEILAGTYAIGILTEGYQSEGKVITVAYDQLTEVEDIFTHEFYYPLEQITATEEENDVLVEWSWTPSELIVDFETGDFSQANFTLPATYPWAITTTNPHEGTYAMKSTCEGIASGTSEIEVTVDVPYDGKMGFWVRVSSEANYDKFHFFIDGVEKGQAISGQQAYAYKEFDVTEGTHTYKWQYAKDSSVNSNDDCVYVDDITLYRYEAPLPPVVGATTYDFEDGTMQGWTTIDANNDGYDWVMGSQVGGVYLASGASLAGSGHNSSNDLVCSGSFSNATGAAITPDNYLVSPLLSAENGAQIHFFACAQDASYAAEHFGVAVSTTTATASAFTMVQEWTMTAKSDAAAEVNSEVRGTRAQGAWYEYVVDLSSYAGQDIYVAIRHFNCNDQFILNVDDITLATGGSKLAPRGDRSLAHYILYRGNVYDSTVVTVADNIESDVMSYVDADWATLPFGMYEWGIQAKYEGYAPTPDATRTEVVIGEGATTNSYLPTNTYYNYSLTEQIYTAAELGAAGTVNSVSFFNTGDERVRDVAVYMAHTTKSVFADNYDWQAMTAADKVFEGTVAFVSGDWTTITFDAPFAYNGTSNVILAVDDNSGSWQSGVPFKADNVNGLMALRAYNDNTNYDPANPSNYSGTTMDVRNQIKLDITGGQPGPGPQPTPGDGLSEIIWSNMIEKDMEATLTFNVTTDNGQAPVGATIAITGDNTYNVAIDETGHATKVVRKGNYVMTATFAGYTTTWSFDGEITADASYDIAFVETIAPVADLYVSPTGWVKWEGGAAPGPGPQPGGNTSFTEGFEGGLNGWNVLTVNADGGEWLHSDDNLGGYDYTTHAHGGTGFAICYSFVDYVGAFDTDSYMYTPQKYAIENGSTLTFWADNANDSYPENFSVCVATVDNPTAADFTQVWSGGAKGTGNSGAAVRHQNNRYDNWRSHSIDLSAYAGQEVYIAFHDVNYDAYEIWIDDVELSAGSDRTALSYKVLLDGKFDGETVYPFFQHNVEGLEEGSVHTTAVRPIYLNGMGDWMYYTWTYTACDNFTGVTNLAAAAQGADVKLTWTMPDAPGPGPGPQPGTGWTEGFENGLPTGWSVIDGNNDGYTWCLTSAIPSTWTYYASLTLDWYRTGTNAICSGSYINGAGALTPNEYLVMGQQAINNGTTFSFWAAATDASYPADHFGVAVSDNGTDWTMVQEWTLTAKKGGANGGRESRDGEGAKLGTWYQFTADLSAHAGNKYIAIRHFNCNDQYIMCVDDIEFTPGKGGRDMWDLVYNFSGTSAGQQAVATDGEYIYTASWQSTPTGGYTFYQYDLEGNFIEGFNIAGATGIRDLTTDGEYFYGTSGGAQIFILDFTTRTLVGTINCSGLTSRHISYDPERDGFWSGNWSTLALYSRTGALIQNGPAPTSAYGSAYYEDADGVEHLYLFCQPNSDCKVYDYNITTGTLGTSVVLDYTATAPGCTGIAGGSFIGAYNGMTCWFGNSQQDPNLIAIFELDNEGPTPPPTPVEGILGAMVFANGEYLAFLEGSATEYVVENAAAFDAEFGVRVVYDGAMDTTYYAMSCMETVEYTGGGTTCDPVTNLTAEYYTYNGNDGALVQFTEPEGATSYKVFVEGQLLGSISAQPIFINFEGTDPGIYEIGIVAVYANCESDMATVDFNWNQSVDENAIVSAIYPNPTSGDLHINATAMTHVSVYNAMGQMVYDQAVSGDELIINMGQFEAGVYMVRIDTENGSSVKRINVVK